MGSGLGSVFSSTAFDVARNLALFMLVVFWIGLAYWAHRDARRRLDDSWLVATATAVGAVPLVGPLVYLLFRPPETIAEVRAREVELRALNAHLRRPAAASCPVCRSDVQADFLVCPVCTTQLKHPCAKCKKPLEALWQVCPYCATPVGAAVVEDLDTALTAEAIAIQAKPKRRAKAARP